MGHPRHLPPPHRTPNRKPRSPNERSPRPSRTLLPSPTVRTAGPPSRFRRPGVRSVGGPGLPRPPSVPGQQQRRVRQRRLGRRRTHRRDRDRGHRIPHHRRPPGRSRLAAGRRHDRLHAARPLRRAALQRAHRSPRDLRRPGALRRRLGLRQPGRRHHVRRTHPRLRGEPERRRCLRPRHLERRPERLRLRHHAHRNRVRRPGRQRGARRRSFPGRRLQHAAALPVGRGRRLQQELGRELDRRHHRRRRGLVRRVPHPLQHPALRQRHPEMGLQRLPPRPAPERGIVLDPGAARIQPSTASTTPATSRDSGPPSDASRRPPPTCWAPRRATTPTPARPASARRATSAARSSSRSTRGSRST